MVCGVRRAGAGLLARAKTDVRLRATRLALDSVHLNRDDAG